MFGLSQLKISDFDLPNILIRVVTANGSVVVASEFQNEDLFFALRGGGFGFGVVVSLTMRTHTLPDLIGGMSGEVMADSRNSFNIQSKTSFF